MKLVSPHKAPERILVQGTYGTGKTYNWFTIANDTPDDVKFYVIDTDQTVLPYVESDEFGHLADRIEVEEPWEWPDYIEFLKRAGKEAKTRARKHWTKGRRSDDWLIIDMASEAWDAVQTYYSDQVFGEDIGDFWLEYRKQAEAGESGSMSAFDGNTDWQAIKKLYKQFKKHVTRFPGHVYLATGEKKYAEHLENEATKRDFGGKQAKGFKPEGEKTLGHMTRTVLRAHNYRYTTIKDRQREPQQGRKVESFAKDYLMRVAGWKPAKAEEEAA